MLFLTICECLGMQLQLSEHFTYPNTLQSQRVRITEVLLYTLSLTIYTDNTAKNLILYRIILKQKSVMK